VATETTTSRDEKIPSREVGDRIREKREDGRKIGPWRRITLTIEAKVLLELPTLGNRKLTVVKEGNFTVNEEKKVIKVNGWKLRKVGGDRLSY